MAREMPAAGREVEIPAMDVRLETVAPTDCRADLLMVAATADWNRGAVKQLDRALKGQLAAEIEHKRFRGAAGDAVLFQTHGALPFRDIVVAGIGDGGTVTPWYRVAHTLVARAQELRAKSAALTSAGVRLSSREVALLAEGTQLAAYSFDRLRSTGPRPSSLRRLSILVPEADHGLQTAITGAAVAARATCYARDLVNLPAGILTPAYLAAEARRIARLQRLRARILDERGLERAGMHALLGVAQGSVQPPRFIELVYTPESGATGGRRQRAGLKCIALAGKGITFDSGGLSLKPAESMQTQKRDMGGAAAVLAVMSVVRDLAIPVEVRAYAPAAENMPGSRAIKPGDVVRAYNGKTIEVLNTDAEGRLVLADALAYAAAAKPDVLIDLATLTAAVRIALGSRYAAIMGTDPSLVRRLIQAGDACGEKLWELPLVADYRSDIDSSVADIKNIGEGGAGTIIGGLFLREFVGNIPWAHIDFSSTVVTDKPFPCHPRGATGFGVRTLLQFLQGL
jgi:leucyl aminopeptidase